MIDRKTKPYPTARHPESLEAPNWQTERPDNANSWSSKTPRGPKLTDKKTGQYPTGRAPEPQGPKLIDRQKKDQTHLQLKPQPLEAKGSQRLDLDGSNINVFQGPGRTQQGLLEDLFKC